MDFLKRLIRLFATNRVDEVEANGGQMLKKTFGDAKYEKLLTDNDFRKKYTIVVEKKQRIEFIADNHEDSTDEQAAECLYLMREAQQEESTETVDILSRLIKETLYKTNWSAKEKAIYDQKVRILVKWKDYFLSYTTRDSGQTNSDFENLVRRTFGYLPKEEDRLKRNFVAAAVVKCLDCNNLTAFFDHDEIKSGDDIEDEVLKYCGATYGLVQLVEHKTFNEPKNRKNWCFEEYKEFDKNCDKLEEICGLKFESRHHFIITGEKLKHLKPANLGYYDVWYNHIDRLKHTSIKDLDNQQLRREVGKIADRIVEVRNKIIDRILGY